MRSLSSLEHLILLTIKEESGILCEVNGDAGSNYPDAIWDKLVQRGLVTVFYCRVCREEHGDITALGRLALQCHAAAISLSSQ